MRTLEQVVADAESAGIPGEVWVGGSFMTTDPEPGDVDVAVMVPVEVCDGPSMEQQAVLLKIQEGEYPHCDSYLLSDCPPDHPHYRPQAITDLVEKLTHSRTGTPRGVAVVTLRCAPTLH